MKTKMETKIKCKIKIKKLKITKLTVLELCDSGKLKPLKDGDAALTHSTLVRTLYFVHQWRSWKHFLHIHPLLLPLLPYIQEVPLFSLRFTILYICSVFSWWQKNLKNLLTVHHAHSWLQYSLSSTFWSFFSLNFNPPFSFLPPFICTCRAPSASSVLEGKAIFIQRGDLWYL